MATAVKSLRDAALPLAVALSLLGAWQAYTVLASVPPYILPAPTLILVTLVKDWGTLSASLVVTLRTTFLSLALATGVSLSLAILFFRWKWVERSFLPLAVVLQVTPVIAISPLLLIYFDTPAAVLICAFLVAFFPVLAASITGLAAVDRNLVDLFRLYRVGFWRELFLLRLPAALPFIMAGVRIGGGLSLVGAIVAEIAAGATGHSPGLAFRIVESAYLVNVPRLFAALTLISVTGVLLYGALAFLSHLLLGRWHESARQE